MTDPIDIALLVSMAFSALLSFYNLTLGAFLTLMVFFSGGVFAIAALWEAAFC